MDNLDSHPIEQAGLPTHDYPVARCQFIGNDFDQVVVPGADGYRNTFSLAPFFDKKIPLIGSLHFENSQCGQNDGIDFFQVK